MSWNENQGMGIAPGGSDDGAFEAFVMQIKEMQRNDPDAKEQWIAYTDAMGQGKRDPSKHDAAFLQAFLLQLNSGYRYPAGDDSTHLGDAIKMMQKRSASFKNIWAHYCFMHGQGRNDPMKHDIVFLAKFFENLAQQASMVSAANPMMMTGGAEMPLKRMKGADGMAMGMGNGGVKEQLVAQVKQFQRQGQQQKDLWGTYADTYLQGVRDPSRHDAATLQEFCMNHSLPTPDASMQGTGGCGMPTAGGCGMPTTNNAEKDAIVQRIKNFQKLSKDNYEIWGTFCGNTRDPNRIDMAKLQEFCQLYSI